MNDDIAYKNCLIRGESFQREKNGAWVAQYTVTLPDTARKANNFPSSQYQFSETFPTESEADEFALQKAREWVDSK